MWTQVKAVLGGMLGLLDRLAALELTVLQQPMLASELSSGALFRRAAHGCGLGFRD